MNFDHNDQFELSYEFLFLLKWLLENETDTLKKLVDRAVRQGYKEKLMKETADGLQQADILNSIVDFLDLLDTLLLDAIHEQGTQKILDRSLIPALDQIDSHECDKTIVQGSLDKVSEKLAHFPDSNPKEVLCKELLKRWKPRRNTLH